MFPLFPILAAQMYSRSLERDDEHRRLMRKIEDDSTRIDELTKKINSKSEQQSSNSKSFSYKNSETETKTPPEREIKGYGITIKGKYKHVEPDKVRLFELRYWRNLKFEAIIDTNELVGNREPSELITYSKDLIEMCVQSFKSGQNKSFNELKERINLDIDSLKIVEIYYD